MDYKINCTGDVVTGDTIRFEESVFGGTHRKPKFLGTRVIEAQVIKDSYGAGKQQHTFTLLIIRGEGEQPLEAGAKTTRKGRNVYRNGTWRKPWADENAREALLNEKHERGAEARSIRDARREGVYLAA